MSRATQLIALDVSALIGQMDFGYVGIRHRKYAKQVNWRDGPKIAYCTAAGGKIVQRSGTVWEINGSGTVSINHVLDRSTRYATTLVLMPDHSVYYQSSGNWYQRLGDKWIPQPHPPWVRPGVAVDNLAYATCYEFCAYATTSRGSGEPCEPSIITTPERPRKLRIDTSILKESVQCPVP